jgi:hypothetical protein
MEPLLTQEMVDPIKSLAVTSRQLYKDRIVIKGIVSPNMGQHCLFVGKTQDTAGHNDTKKNNL